MQKDSFTGKKQEKTVEFYSYQVSLKGRLEIEELLCIDQGRDKHFQTMWSEIYQHV